MARRPYTRRIKFIRPALQMRMTVPFLGVAAGALLLQFILLTVQIDDLAMRLPPEAARVREGLPSMLLTVLGISAGLILPLTAAVGVVATFKVAGPIFRFEQHLNAIARGEDPGICCIRKTDELHGLCDSINAAVARLREGPAGPAGPAPDGREADEVPAATADELAASSA